MPITGRKTEDEGRMFEWLTSSSFGGMDGKGMDIHRVATVPRVTATRDEFLPGPRGLLYGRRCPPHECSMHQYRRCKHRAVRLPGGSRTVRQLEVVTGLRVIWQGGSFSFDSCRLLLLFCQGAKGNIRAAGIFWQLLYFVQIAHTVLSWRWAGAVVLYLACRLAA